MSTNSDHIILSTMYFIAYSDQFTMSEKAIINSFISSGSFLRKHKLNYFIKNKINTFDFDSIIQQTNNLSVIEANNLVENVIKLICADGIISHQEAAVTTILCARLGVDHDEIFRAIHERGLDITSYNEFIRKNTKQSERREIGFLAAKTRIENRNNNEMKPNFKSSIFCKYCGKSGLTQGAAYCKSCGKKIN